MNINDCVDHVLYTEKDLQIIAERLGKEITSKYDGKDLLLVSVLKGSVVFLTDLMRNIDLDCSIDFMVVSSYGSDVKTSGVVKIIKDLDEKIEGKDVLIIEDILDSGLTLTYLMKILEARKPSSIKICTLLDKPSGRKTDITADFVGAEVPDEFIVGYGLDYSQKFRNLPYIGVLKKEVYMK